jgi:hypothetical protein
LDGGEEQTPTDGARQSEDSSDEITARFRQVTNFRSFVRQLKVRRYVRERFDAVIASVCS